MRNLEAIALRFRKGIRLGQHVRHWSKHQCQRRAKFMAYIGEESGFCAVEFRESFRAATFCFVCARIRDCRRDLSCQEIEEGAALIVQRKSRRDSGDQDSRRTVLARCSNRHDPRTMWCFRPNATGQLAETWNDVCNLNGAVRLHDRMERP